MSTERSRFEADWEEDRAPTGGLTLIDGEWLPFTDPKAQAMWRAALQKVLNPDTDD
jgi:hypothetical protein